MFGFKYQISAQRFNGSIKMSLVLRFYKINELSFSFLGVIVIILINEKHLKKNRIKYLVM